MAATYPEGMSPELAGRLYDGASVDVNWAENDAFTYDEDRSECVFWLEHCTASLRNKNGRYDQEGASWPPLHNVIRRHDDNKIRVFQWASGLTFEQTT